MLLLWHHSSRPTHTSADTARRTQFIGHGCSMRTTRRYHVALVSLKGPPSTGNEGTRYVVRKYSLPPGILKRKLKSSRRLKGTWTLLKLENRGHQDNARAFKDYSTDARQPFSDHKKSTSKDRGHGPYRNIARASALV